MTSTTSPDIPIHELLHEQIAALEHHLLCPQSMNVVDLQIANERIFCRDHIDRTITAELYESDGIGSVLQAGGLALVSWADEAFRAGTYESRAKRLVAIAQLDEAAAESLMSEIIVKTCHAVQPLKLAVVASQLAHTIERYVPSITDRREQIQTAAELLAVLRAFGLYQILRGENPATGEQAVLLISRIQLSMRCQRYIANTTFTPPLLAPPRPVRHNGESGYHTRKGSVLMNGAHHEDPVALDVINRQNTVALRLNTAFLSSHEERPKSEPDTPIQAREWERFVHESAQLAAHLAVQSAPHGSELYFNHRYDSRGRLYPDGYHITYMGSAFKKASLELAAAERVTGAPTPV